MAYFSRLSTKKKPDRLSVPQKCPHEFGHGLGGIMKISAWIETHQSAHPIMLFFCRKLATPPVLSVSVIPWWTKKSYASLVPELVNRFLLSQKFSCDKPVVRRVLFSVPIFSNRSCFVTKWVADWQKSVCEQQNDALSMRPFYGIFAFQIRWERDRSRDEFLSSSAYNFYE